MKLFDFIIINVINSKELPQNAEKDLFGPVLWYSH